MDSQQGGGNRGSISASGVGGEPEPIDDGAGTEDSHGDGDGDGVVNCWVAVKELISSYYLGEAIILRTMNMNIYIYIYMHYGNLMKVP